MLQPVVHPWPLRILNALGGVLRRAGLRSPPLDERGLEARAARQEGLSDFGEPDFEEGLAVLCRSAERDANLRLTGRLLYREHITNALKTRLRRIEVRRRCPEAFRTPLVPPLIVLGLPRSGTTLLHRMLSLAGDARAPALWEMQRPIASSGHEDRRELSLREIAKLRKAAPDIDVKHELDPDQPEEDFFLFDSSLWSFSFWVIAPVYGYLDWYLTHDPRPGYRVYLEHLRLFQHASPGKRLTLKAPAHTAYVDTLLETVPDAMIVQTHRDPVESISSMNSVMYTVHSYLTDDLDLKRMAMANLSLYGRTIERNMAARSRIPEGRIVDIRYADLTADPVATVRSIYDHFNLPFGSGFEARLRAWRAERPRERSAKHEYSAEDFGITGTDIAERFKDYTSHFLASP